MDLFVIGLAVGAVAGWIAKDEAVWPLVEALRYWRTECLAAERDLRDAGRWRGVLAALPVRPPRAVPPVVRTWVVRIATRQRRPWRPAPWPGWRPAP